MIDRSIIRRLLLGLSTGLALAVAGVAVPVIVGAPTPAMAQSSDDMAAALDAYGHWISQAPYGEVWVPDGVPPDWRPYEYGHWVYTDDWGWYWVSDENEDDWGWIVYHYGRWANNRDIGWFWVPGDEWAPAWVDWRYGGDDIGWAPLPPDDMIDAYEAEPDSWVFVPLRYIGEPRLRTYFVPRDRRSILLRETRIINRPVRVESRRLWVNPGLAPGFISGRTHVALHAYKVRPRVFSGTTNVQGAVTVPKQDLRIKGAVRRVAPITVQRSVTAIAPTVGAPPPQPLNKGEHGRLGTQPPRAAQGIVTPQPPGPASVPKTGAPVIQHPGPAPVVTPAKPPEHIEERREVHPPAGASGPPAGSSGPPKPPIVHPVAPQTPPPVVHAPPPPPPLPPVVHAPPPPVVHAPPPPPPPAVHAPPPPPAAHAPPPPPKGPPPKSSEKPPEPPK
jgi:hypothetical protein